jgi:hypothetical protein
MEIEGQVRWPRPAGLGAVAPGPQKKVQGVRVAVRVESNHRISAEEFGLAVMPVLQEYGLEIVGEPKLVIDDSPIWVWRKVPQDPSIPGVKPGDFAWMAVLGAGPLKGHEGKVMALSDCTQKYDPKTGQELDWKCTVGTPTVEHTAELPKYVEDWSVSTRPVDLELPESKVGQLRAAMRGVRQKLQALAGGMVGTSVKPADVPAPKPAPKLAAATGTAAIIGIALAMLTWGKRV